MSSEISQESCTEHCMSMLRGELPYHAKFYAIKSKSKSGDSKPDDIKLVTPTQQQILQAKSQLQQELKNPIKEPLIENVPQSSFRSQPSKTKIPKKYKPKKK